MTDPEKMTYTSSPDMEKEHTDQNRRRSVPGKVAKHANDADEAMKAFAGHEGEVLEMDEATSKRLLRRIDLHLMPVSVLRKALPEFSLTVSTAVMRNLWPQLP